MTLRGKPFRKGFDKRRHELTPTERQLGGEVGYLVASKKLAGDVAALAWLFRRVRSNCRARKRGKEVTHEV